MEWWIIAALGCVVLLLIKLYWTSVLESRGPANFALLILLDDKVYQAQREGLAKFVRTNDAKNAGELGSSTYLATCNLAAKLSHNVLGGLLWKLKNSPA